MCDGMDCMDCKNELNLCKLCVKKARVKCLCAHSIASEKICADRVEAHHLVAESEVVNDICVSRTLQAQNVATMNLNSNNLCSQNGVINKLCVNDLTVGSMNKCEKWRATATFTTDTSYPLGSNINWDTIVDDPNGNISLSPFFYTVPISGYYVATFYCSSDSLSGTSIITGAPVGVSTLTVNGIESRQMQTPYLSFTGFNKNLLSSVVLLNAGDVVTMNFNIFVLDPVFGLVPYVGTVNINSIGFVPLKSSFEIHYLSSLECSPVTCNPCPPVQITCQPVEISCGDCIKPAAHEDPCDSCQ